ncbi:MOSC domain-containing protein [Roseibacillus ishigakijimensis]|uniref:MOSC domain-containing protein n=1 Tax=Roseibacillus ishigakijimensis TaxID=454146 RepID=A0A934RLL4_9BACT|nr:MOSC domain-containing protein [Roseibacillus ishigakijimensis]MBK1833654.1 MOSC domain-containing protein [Roseibacillus ishigakijimensis]
MTAATSLVELTHLFVSPGHDFKGRHGLGRENYEIVDQEQIELVAGKGIAGDRYFDYKPDFKGQITFFDEAVWLAVREQFALPELPPSVFRRNVIVRGMDLNALIGKRFALGELELTGSEEAKPCYWMDEACAPGVEEFLKGKGGLRCRIVKGGLLSKGPQELRVLANS